MSAPAPPGRNVFAGSGTATPMIGIVEVAARAGVSPATVSRALRGIPGVSAGTRRAVEKAAADLGYVASASASALARGRTSAIGVMAPWISRWFFSAIIEGAQDVVAERGYDVLLYPLGANAGPDAASIKARTLSKKVDGVLALNVPLHIGTVAIVDLRLPVVTVGAQVPGLSGVMIDDRDVGYQATRHLLELGHRRIAFLGLDPDSAYGFSVASDRHSGYQAALREAGIEPDPALVQTTGFSVEAGEAAVEHQLMLADWDIRQLPTAIVAVSDEVAMGVLYAARKRGVRIPEDVSLIGVDDHDLAYLFDLTTIGQPVREQGRQAAGLLMDRITCPEQSDLAVIRVDAQLVLRNTTAPPRK